MAAQKALALEEKSDGSAGEKERGREAKRSTTGRGWRDSNSLSVYFKEIARIPLLTRDEEIKLARRVRKGDSAALEHLVTANLRFVVSVAKKYSGIGLSLEDLVCEGNAGLIRAARRFDERRGVRFLSYGVWWVKQAMLQALAEQVHLVRLPLNRTGLLHRMQKKADELRKALEREPTHAEIAKAMSLTEDEVVDTFESMRTYLSLDGGIDGNEEEVGLFEFLSDSSAASPDERVAQSSLGDDLGAAVGALPPREAEIIRLYYGIGTDRGQTLEEIGDKFHLSRERVRQIKEVAIRRLQHNPSGEALRSYLS